MQVVFQSFEENCYQLLTTMLQKILDFESSNGQVKSYSHFNTSRQENLM